jgi:hypothetical protein
VHPDWDGWVWVGFLKSHWERGESLWRVLLYKHGDHPWGLPGVLYVLFGGLAHYQFDLIAILSSAAVVVTALLMLVQAWRAEMRTFWPLLAIALMVLCARQASDNFLLAFQSGFTLTVLFGVIAVICSFEFAHARTTRARVCSFAGLVTALVLGGFCSAAFLAAVPAMAIPLLLRRDRPSLAALVAITVLAGAWFLLFFRGQSPPMQASSFSLMAPVVFLSGLAVYAGMLFAKSLSGLVTTGLIVLGLFGWLAATAWPRADAPRRSIIVIGLFALGMLALLAFGRSDAHILAMIGAGQGGIAWGVPSRYATFSALLAGATVFLALDRLETASPGIRTAGKVAVALAVAGSLFVNVREALDRHWLLQGRAATVLASLAHYKTQSPEQLAVTYPFSPAFVPPLIKFLDDHSLNIFAHREFYAQFADPLPASAAKRVERWESRDGAKYAAAADGSGVMRGPGRILAPFPCPAGQPCFTRFEAHVVSAGRSTTVGVIFRDRKGRVIEDPYISVEGMKDQRVVQTVFAPGETAQVDAYVFAGDPNSEVRFRDFTVTIGRIKSPERGCGRIFCLFGSMARH